MEFTKKPRVKLLILGDSGVGAEVQSFPHRNDRT